MNNSENSVEQKAVATKSDMPPLTVKDLEANIASEHYFTAGQGVQQAQEDAQNGRSDLEKDSPLHLITLCVLILRNGFTVTATSIFADFKDFDPTNGRRIARQNATQKVWMLMRHAQRSFQNPT